MDISTVSDIVYERANRFPAAVITEWTGNTKRSVNTRDFVILVERYASYCSSLKDSGCERVATFFPSTRIDTLAFEFGALRVGLVICPLHDSTSVADMQRSVQNLHAHVFVTTSSDTASSFKKRLAQNLETKLYIIADLHPRAEVVHDLSFEPSDAALIISTSGTSGESKGVLLSHEAVVSTLLCTLAAVPLSNRSEVLSFLPASHILERMAIWTSLLSGASIHLAENPRHGYGLLRVINPHYFTAVPRVLERIYSRFEYASKESGFFARVFYEWIGHAASRGKVGRTLARLFVMQRLRRLFGRRLKGILVGSAAMDPKLIRWFDTAGVTIRQGYGLSELCGIVTVNRFSPGEYDLESVGRPLPGVEVDIDNSKGPDGQGEVMVRSPGLMIGYWTDGRLNAVHESDSFFRTGDIGRIDDRGFLFITGRLRDNFKNASGQFVSPAQVEQGLRTCPGISNAAVIGLARPFNIALICPDFELVEQWSRDNNVHWTAPEYMVHNPEIRAYFQTLVDGVNTSLAPHERITKFHLTAVEWTPESGLVTAMGKPKRSEIEHYFAKEIDDLYEL